MTAEVVRGYFLKAGASFRRSDAWRRIHETPEGKSRVLRSGRFGVGVLAAFLLGNEVEVSTRSVTAEADKGITFKATIDTEEIELRFCSRPIGTTVTVRIDEKDVWESLSNTLDVQEQAYYSAYSPAELDKGTGSWDWYCLADPKVLRVLTDSTGPQRLLEQKFSLLGSGEPPGPRWRKIKHPNYADIQWSYWEGPFLACNGIVVARRDPKQTYYYDAPSTLGTSGYLDLTWPRVSVFDPDGHLPLVLQRNALATQKYPFDEQLFADVIRDLLAYLLVRAPRRPLRPLDRTSRRYEDWYPGVSTRSRLRAPSFHLCSAKDGLYLADEWNVKQGGFHKFVLVGGLAFSGKSEARLPRAGTERSLLIPVPSPNGRQRYREWNRFALCGSHDSQFGYVREFAVTCRRMLLPRDEYDLIKGSNVIARYLWSAVAEESSNKQWVVLRTGDCDCGDNFDLLEFSSSITTRAPEPILIEWHLAVSQSEPKELPPLATIWRDFLKSPVIPYDPTERSKTFAEAFDQLGDYIAAHEQIFAEQEKAKKAKKKGLADQSDDSESNLVP
jgi:hypothetical protein